jgi:hypothetical protein
MLLHVIISAHHQQIFNVYTWVACLRLWNSLGLNPQHRLFHQSYSLVLPPYNQEKQDADEGPKYGSWSPSRPLWTWSAFILSPIKSNHLLDLPPYELPTPFGVQLPHNATLALVCEALQWCARTKGSGNVIMIFTAWSRPSSRLLECNDMDLKCRLLTIIFKSFCVMT